MIARFLPLLASRAGMVAIALVAGYLVGHKAASDGRDARQLRAEAQSLQADLAMFQAAASAAEREAEQLRKLQDNLQEKLDGYSQELAERGEDNACRLDGADVERLRKLR